MRSHNIPIIITFIPLLLTGYLSPRILPGFKHIENKKRNLFISETSKLNIVLSIQ